MSKEVVQLAGDMDQGIAITHDLRKNAKTVVLEYKGRYAQPYDSIEVVCEVYEAAGVLSIHTLCPKCKKAVWIKGDQKRVEMNDRGLFTETFTCPWELGDHGGKQEFGFGLCGFRSVYDGKVVREA